MLQQPIRECGTEPVTPLFGVLSNPTSTRNRAHLSAVRTAAGARSPGLHRAVDRIADIPAVLQDFAQAGVTHLVINGGDGTIQAVLSDLARLNRQPAWRPVIAVLPGGKTNLVARNLGLTEPPERLLGRLFDLADRGRLDDHVIAHPLIELDLGDGQTPHVGLFFGGAGLVGALVWCRDSLYTRGWPLSLAHTVAFVTLVGGALVGRGGDFLHRPLTLETPGGRRATGTFMVAVGTTLDRLLLRLRPFDAGRADDGAGRLHMTAIASRPGAILRALWALGPGRFGWGRGVYSVNAERVWLHDSGPVVLDGEIFHPAPGAVVTLRAGTSVPMVSLKPHHRAAGGR
ncbi:hypothetical protein CCR85_11190 [Rhodothalassium salexigens]|uniref:diacylglycerol/lipid kinase family protein n=1 Tax=Rhodothalassium salexigens TaxID=1086 RepID=UPI001911FD6C|nr:diacylglycerol kinase family protein [Rhodothalassium salexigens]MBK5912053.1 hypothetical protein [Rhodothalassium salexigens]